MAIAILRWRWELGFGIEAHAGGDGGQDLTVSARGEIVVLGFQFCGDHTF